MPAARDGGFGVRVGIDGCVPDDGAALADAVADRLLALGLAVARVCQDDFWLPRSQRLEHGPRDPDALYDHWYDDGALRREVLDRLGPADHDPAGPSWLPSLRDPMTDRSTRAARRPAAPGPVADADGRFLLRWELADAFDVSVHLATSPPAQERRLTDEDERARAVPAWARYLDETDPAARATFVVRYDHPARPAVQHAP
ncbi:MAG: uridine kinase [Angustibacter sp.]